MASFSRFNGGRPDVVFMTYDRDGGIYTPAAGEYVDDYDIGIARYRLGGPERRGHGRHVRYDFLPLSLE
ncbi:hypothetical protein [Rhodococcus sp. 24CO]|uniref:hypothetical protein n=1 Tax=Rhodococcus sp. 24CO TaxID=3117460 RepID=UPI003D33F75F